MLYGCCASGREEGTYGRGVVFAAGIVWLVIALVTVRQAADRGRSQWGGILFGMLLGPLGLAIVMLLPRQ